MTALTRTRGLPGAAVAVLLLSAAGALALAMGPADYPELHTILDTGVAMLSGVLALLLWDMGSHTKSNFVKWLSVGFGLTFALDITHVLVSVDWGGILSPIASARGSLRPATWSPSAYLLPIAVAGALWRLYRSGDGVVGFAVATVALAALLFVLFQQVPTYLPPDFMGVTRPALIAVPLLWLATAAWAWRLRDRHRLALPIVWAAAALFVGHAMMLYSASPADGQAMMAHVGKIAGYLVLLLCVTKMASRDMRDRITAEAALAALNAGLDQQVAQRTSELMSAHENLDRESSQRRRADAKALEQLARLSLLQQITRAIGDRQDLDSIFQVAVRSVEEQLPVDFACLCTYDAGTRSLTVAAVGANSPELGLSLATSGAMTFDVDENHLTKCIEGAVLYEPDISAMRAPFQAHLALTGLHALVAAPLQVESKLFGCFIAARLAPDSFVSADCEFLRQLSEHIALAAHQVELHSALQTAYDDLRQTQQSVMQQERLRALGQMASGIAHDINNALSPVALYTEALLETEKGLSPTARNQLEVIRRAVEDVSHTIGRMREFYRQSERQLPGAPLQLNDLARQVLDLTRPRWADMSMQRGAVVTVETELAQDLPAVLGAESEIREALTNLVFNAIDAMPDGGTLTLRTAPADEPGWVRIDVGDSGVGMDAEARRRCMEPFFTTKGERGTGLGLAMVYGVAQRHGAEVDIQSAPGEGTTFSLIFPAATRNAATGEAEIETPPPMRLLLVDDDPVLLKALSDALGNDGHQITPANDGQAGIDAFVAGQDGHPFDAVITDLGMPYINGRQVAAAIKSTSPGTPVILLTGWGQGMLSGVEGIPNVDLVLGKPPKLREVRAALARHSPEGRRVSGARDPDGGPPRLLIVDDEAANLQALQSTLAGQGYEVEGFTDPAAALAAFKADAFDLLLTDLVMPGIGGMTLMQEMRARDPDLAVVIMTGEGSIASAVEAMREGAMDYVLKPLRLSTLLPVISRALTVRDLRRENARLERGLLARTTELERALEEVDRQAAERVLAEQALMQAQKIEAIGRLTGGVAHDFNNLLTPIIGYLELLQRVIGEGETHRRFVDTALEAAHRGAKVAGHLLAFSRTQRLNLRPVDVDQTLRNSDGLFGHALGAEIRLETDLAAGPAWSRTDATQLELAVLNLVVNARDAMPEGGLIQLSTRADAEAVTVEVCDTGKGMAPEVLARATEPFFTTKSHQGSGLGLAQVAAFARQCGGTCEIESAPGEGTTVRITLPRAEAPPAPVPVAIVERTASPGRGLSVVVIDDDDHVRQILCDGLFSEGFTVRGAANGPSGLTLVDADPPDAVVLDYAMPGMTGAEVAQQMRVRHPHLPIVFCSGYADSLALDQIPDAVVLRKPVTIDDLSRTVRSSIG